jgi:non-haem Fe2+, alpha-ketoglutarate-dependent halogenase
MRRLREDLSRTILPGDLPFRMSEYDLEVSKLRRDLRFFPVSNPSPKKFTAQQIQTYNEKGYLTGFRVLDAAEAREAWERSDRLLDRFVREGKGSYAIDRYQDRFRTIWDLATAPTILDYAEDLIGPNIVCWATHYFCKLPGDPKGVAWHQDCSYWPLTPSKTVTVWLAIDDVDRENGCMQVIPRSHLHGHLAFRESTAAEQNVLSQTIDGAERYGTPEDIELKAGEISLHCDLLVHGSLPNLSNRRRCGLTLRYCPPDVRAYWDWNQKSILCRGTDVSGHWASVPRPMAD